MSRRTSPAGKLDVRDVDACPVGHRCLTCGIWQCDLRACAVDLIGYGVGCITLCGSHYEAGRVPNLTAREADRLVVTHAGHLGITVAQMDAALPLILRRSQWGNG